MSNKTEVIPHGTPEQPVYRKVNEQRNTATEIFMIVCDEGWRESIVCTGMYEWSANFILSHIQGKPYNREIR